MRTVPFVITIDGPTASGKTSVARGIATKYGFFHLRGRTFLRAFALHCLRTKTDPTNQEHLEHLLDTFTLAVQEITNTIDYNIILNREIVNNFLSTPEVDAIVSATSRSQAVRVARVLWKRNLAKNRQLVADGRTLGSEVFPNANIKFHLTASLDQRAMRRYVQYSILGKSNLSLEDIRNSIAVRDTNDSIGELDRTLIFPDQHFIDSTAMNFSEVIFEISKIVDEKIKLLP